MPFRTAGGAGRSEGCLVSRAVKMLEPDSVFLEPPPSTLQRPSSIEPCAVEFLAGRVLIVQIGSNWFVAQSLCTLHKTCLIKHEFLERSRGGQYLKPFISDAERFMPPSVEKLGVSRRIDRGHNIAASRCLRMYSCKQFCHR
jgi:hypothetical protein